MQVLKKAEFDVLSDLCRMLKPYKGIIGNFDDDDKDSYKFELYNIEYVENCKHLKLWMDNHKKHYSMLDDLEVSEKPYNLYKTELKKTC